MKGPVYCGSCGAPYLERERRANRRRCPRCGRREAGGPAAISVALITREQGSTTEALFLCRDLASPSSGGLWCLPGDTVAWGEDLRATAARAAREKIGLKILSGRVIDTQSGYSADQQPLVVSWFDAALSDPDAQPRPGPHVERVAWFPLDAPPELAFETDQRLLQRRARSESHEPDKQQAETEARIGQLESQLARQDRRYHQLMDLYMQELMRGAWINDLLVQVANTTVISEIASFTCEHFITQSDLGLVRIWHPGPPDRCDSCPWAEHCPQKECLHLITEVGERSFAALRDAERIPPIAGTQPGNTAIRNAVTDEEVERPNARSTHFEGFPLDVNLELPAVLGLYSSERREPSERRIFQFVARYLGAAIKNARLHQELRRSDQVKRIFIDKMSNELKTPLTVILGYAELLKEDRESDADPYGAESASAIEKSGRNLFNLVESILFMTKLESARITPKLKRLNARNVLDEIIEQHRGEIERKGLELRLEGVPEQIWADPSWVRRIVGELLKNACKFTPRGTVTVAISTAPKDMVCISVEDSGIGLAKTGRSRIFEPFTQGTEVSDDYKVNLNYGGLGVGLAIARTLTELSGGKLTVESNLERGSRFALTLPRSALPAP
jgi:signal transduction histidine kinase/ADP-ribose pyrophosphatase YjhB (NUDIX family)